MQVPCTQCGGSVPLAEDSRFLVCDYCSSTLYVEGGCGRGSWYVQPLLDEEAVRERVRSVVGAVEYLRLAPILLPFREERERDKTVVRSAATVSVDLSGLRSLPGTRQGYACDVLSSWDHVPPELCPSTSCEDLSLVFFPLFRVEYRHGLRSMVLYVDAVTGTPYADELPTLPTKEKNAAFFFVLTVSFLIYVAVFHVSPGGMASRIALVVPSFFVLTLVTARIVARRP